MGTDAATKTAAWPDGPWRVEPDDRPHMEWNNHVIDVNGNRVCFLANGGPAKQTKYDAAAHLIASAPDLYAALKDVLRVAVVTSVGCPDIVSICEAARAAIAAAEGSAP